MSLTIFEGIPKYGRYMCPLRTLVDILQKISSGRPFSILEIDLLSEFPATNVLLPDEQFSPRWIIEYMKEIHGNPMERISRTSSDLDTLVYKYNSGDKEKEYKFSNDMVFYIDIITICYLYFIMQRSEYEKFAPAIHLLRIMKTKYNIYDNLNLCNAEATRAEIITWRRIAYSYPSITFALLYHDIVDSPLPSNTIFSIFNLPKIYHLSLITSIIPALDQTTPLALLLVIAVFLDRYDEYERGGITPLDRLYFNTLNLYTSKVFPKCLKLELCKKWGIVNMIGSQYKFAPYFEMTREDAKKLISDLRWNEHGLEYILSNI